LNIHAFIIGRCPCGASVSNHVREPRNAEADREFPLTAIERSPRNRRAEVPAGDGDREMHLRLHSAFPEPGVIEDSSGTTTRTAGRDGSCSP
jgi:hypothetical protein